MRTSLLTHKLGNPSARLVRALYIYHGVRRRQFQAYGGTFSRAILRPKEVHLSDRCCDYYHNLASPSTMVSQVHQSSGTGRLRHPKRKRKGDSKRNNGLQYQDTNLERPDEFTPGQQLTFLDLPEEIRAHMYSYLVNPVSWAVIHGNMITSKQTRLRKAYFALARTCRTIRADMLDLLRLCRDLVEVHSGQDLARLAPDTVRLLRRVEIDSRRECIRPYRGSHASYRVAILIEKESEDGQNWKVDLKVMSGTTSNVKASSDNKRKAKIWYGEHLSSHDYEAETRIREVVREYGQPIVDEARRILLREDHISVELLDWVARLFLAAESRKLQKVINARKMNESSMVQGSYAKYNVEA